jgi:hypothetical protein
VNRGAFTNPIAAAPEDVVWVHAFHLAAAAQASVFPTSVNADPEISISKKDALP